jgi:hypothetical protein
MPNRILATVLGAGLAACGSGSPPPQQPANIAVPPLVVTTTNAVTALEIRINDLPLSQREIGQYIPIPDESYPVPPYFFKKGTNTISIRYQGIAETDQPYDLKVKIGAAELVGEFDACTGSETTCEAQATFELTNDIPRWNWQTGDEMTASAELRESLYKEYEKLLADWRAAVPRDEDGLPVAGAETKERAATLREELARLLPEQPRTDLDDLVTLISHPASLLDDLVPDMPELDMGVDVEVFAAGRLARLWRGTMPILIFKGGVHDAQEGQMGPFSVTFDVWFRREGETWIVAAIWRADVMPTLPEV